MSTYEERILQDRIMAVEYGPVAIHRISIFTCVEADAIVRVDEETNDDDDDGYPGAWVRWSNTFPSLDSALRYAGKCRVGISGVIVTVTLDGKEVR